MLVTLLEFLFNCNSLKSDFSRPFFSPGTLQAEVSWPPYGPAGLQGNRRVAHGGKTLSSLVESVH